MAGEDKIGTARLSIKVDLAEYNAGITSATGKLDAFGKDAVDAFAASNSAQKKAITSLVEFTQRTILGTEAFRQLKAENKGVPSPIIAQSKEQLEAYRKKIIETKDAETKLADDTAFIAAAKRKAAVYNKLPSEILAYDASVRGITKSVEAEIAALKKSEAALLGGAAANSQYGRSQKQVAAALRGVPAQITDIAVSLQGGQNPLTVLLQQGGQLKDLFGGIRPAAAALATQLFALINPYTILAVAIGGAAIAWYQADKAQRAFSNSITLAGPGIGQTAQSLQAMSTELTDLNVTSTAATDAIFAVAKSGKFADQQFREVAKAALLFQEATGQAVDETVADFNKLAGDPVKAAVELDKKYNFLTASVYAQIRALNDQGREQEAINILVNQLSDTIANRSVDVIKNTNAMGQAWRNFKVDISNTRDVVFAFLSGAGNLEKASLSLAVSKRNLESYQSTLGRTGVFDTSGIKTLKELIEREKLEISRLEKVVANDPLKLAAVKARDTERANDISIALGDQAEQYKTASAKNIQKIKVVKAQALEAIAIANRDGNKALADQLRKDALISIKGIEAADLKGRAKPKDGTGAARTLANAENKDDLRDFKNTLLEKQAALQNDTKILQAEYAAKLIGSADYYAKSKVLLIADGKAQEEALAGQINVLKQRDLTGKDSVTNLTELKTLESQLAKARLDNATSVKILDINEQARSKNNKNQLEDFKASLDASTLALRNQYDLQLLKVAISDKEFEKRSAEIAITNEYVEAIKRLNVEKSRAPDDAEAQSKLDAEIEAYRAATEAKLKEVRRFYDESGKAQEDWLGGVKKGIADWVDQAGKVAEQTAAITNRALDTLTDGLVEFATTGKLLWKDMLRDILKQIAAFLIKQAVLAFVKLIAGFFGGGDNIAGAASSAGAKSASIGTTSIGTKSFSPIPTTANGKIGAVGGAGKFEININTTLNSNGSSSSDSKNTGTENTTALNEFTQRMKNIANQELIRATQPGGSLHKLGLSSG